MSERGDEIHVLLIGNDLNAIARLEASGATVRMTRPGSVVDALAADPDVLVADLDAGGPDLLEELRLLGEARRLPSRVIGYFSHIDEALGAAAATAGIKAVPRGRFWRSLNELL